MIPISQDEKLVYDDSESGVRYYLKPITGANELQYLSILEKYKKGMPREEEFLVLDEMTNFIICGWESLGTIVVNPFPSDGKPSKCLNSFMKNKLIEIASNLNGLSVLEVKN